MGQNFRFKVLVGFALVAASAAISGAVADELTCEYLDDTTKGTRTEFFLESKDSKMKCFKRVYTANTSAAAVPADGFCGRCKKDNLEQYTNLEKYGTVNKPQQQAVKDLLSKNDGNTIIVKDKNFRIGEQDFEQGSKLKIIDQKDGKRTIVQVNDDGKHVGKMITPDGKEYHSRVEYTNTDTKKTYYSLEEAKADGLDKVDPKIVSVTKYDENGNASKPKTLAEAREDAKGASKAEREKEKQEKTKYDECQKSVKYAEYHKLEGSEKFNCSSTHTIAEAAGISNQVLSTAGRTMVNQMGGQAAGRARNGSLASTHDAAAQMAKTTKNYETVLGVANIAAAVAMGKKASQHKKNLTALESTQLTDAANAGLSSDTGGLDTSNAANEARRQVSIDEQAGARKVAATAALKSTIVAAQSMMAAKIAGNMEKSSKKIALEMRATDKKIRENTFSYDPSQLLPRGNGVTDFSPNGNALTAGTGDLTSTSDTSNIPEGGDGGAMLGKGSDTGAGDESIKNPTAGAHKLGAAPGGGGGGGGGGASAGGGGGGGGPTGEDAKAAYASEFGTKERYESGGAGGGAKPGAKAGGGADTGIDLNGLLAQFLPKGEEDMGPKNGILDSVDFNGGARNLANEEAPSYLDKNADLFQRIHETMSEKNRRGQLGI